MRLQLEDLESRVLLAGTPVVLVIQVQPTQTALGTPMFPAMQVAICDSSQQTVTTDTSTVVLTMTSAQSGGQFVVGGVTSSTVSVKAVNGVATFSDLSFSKTGIYAVTVGDGSLVSMSSNFFNVTAAAAKLALVQLPPASITAGTQFTPAIAAWVEDAGGNLVTSDRSAVTLSIVSGPSGGSLTGTTTVNAVTGVAIFNGVGFSKGGSYVLKVTDGTLTAAQSTTITVGAAPATSVSLAFAGTLPGVVAGATLPPIIVNVTDSAGAILTTDSSTVTLSIVSGPTGATITGNATVNAVNGVATFSDLSLAKAGSYTLKATAGSASTNSNSFTVTAGDASKLVFLTSPINAPAGATVPAFRVTITDAFENLITTATGDVTLTLATGPGGGTVSGTMMVSAINGVALFSDLTFDAMGTYTLTASSGTLSAGTGTFLITGSASQLAFEVQPTTVGINSAISPAVVVYLEDANGNLVTNATGAITISLASGPGSLSGTTTVTAINGSASFSDLALSAVGTYTLSAAGTGLTAAVSSSFTVSPATAGLAFVTQPSNVPAGGTASMMFPAVTVQIVDTTGNLVSNSSASVTLTIVDGPQGATMGGTTTVTAVNGVATFSNLNFTVQGGYVLVASSGTLMTDTSARFLVTGPAAKLQFAAVPADKVTAGHTMRISAWVEDINGNIITTAHSAVTLAIVSGTGPTGATITGNATVNAVDGLATFEVALTKQGTYQLTVTSAGLTAANTKKFSVMPDSSQAHVVVTRSPAATVAGRTFVSNPVISIIDNYSNVIDTSATVVIGIASGPGGTLRGTTTVRAKHGVAQFGGMSINQAGTYSLMVTAPNLATPSTASFAMTISQVMTSLNKPSVSSSYTVGADFKLTAQLRGVISSPLAWTGTAELVDSANNVLATATVASNGVIRLMVPGQTAGMYAVKVRYSGDVNHLGGTSPAFNLVVGPKTTVTVSASDKTIGAGDELTLNVSVGASSRTARTGIVQLLDGTTVIDTQTVNSLSQATFIQTPTAGTHTYTVVYSGDSAFPNSVSTALNVTVAQEATTTTLTQTVATVNAGETLTLDVAVAGLNGTTLARAGTVTLKDGTTSVGTLTLASSAGVFSIPNISAGVHQYTATYSGNSNFLSSVSTLLEVTVS